jgi:hypothetical protein
MVTGFALSDHAILMNYAMQPDVQLSVLSRRPRQRLHSRLRRIASSADCVLFAFIFFPIAGILEFWRIRECQRALALAALQLCLRD